MASGASQIAAVTAMNLRSIRERVTSSIVALVGIAGVVTVLIGVLSIGEGFRAVLDQSGAADVAIVLRGGATDEMGSGMSQEQTRIISDVKDIKRDAAGAVASPELYVVVDVPTTQNRNGRQRAVARRLAECQQTAPGLPDRRRHAISRRGNSRSSSGAARVKQFAGLDSRQQAALGHDGMDGNAASSRTAAASRNRKSGPMPRCCRVRTTAAPVINRCASS